MDLGEGIRYEGNVFLKVPYNSFLEIEFEIEEGYVNPEILAETTECYFYVSKDLYRDYIVDYYWGNISQYIRVADN